MKNYLKLILIIIYVNSYSQITFFTIDGHQNDFSFCDTNGNFTINSATPYQGKPNIVWSLYKNNIIIKTIENHPKLKINGTDYITFTIPKDPGIYRVERRYKNISGTTLSSYNINVTSKSSGINGPAFIINNQIFANTQQDIYNINSNGTIKLNASISCETPTQFFVSIQLSDIYFNRYNHEAMGWFSSSSNKYGNISNFNLKAFAEERWFSFHSGQYYRVKIAYANPWREFNRLIKVYP